MIHTKINYDVYCKNCKSNWAYCDCKYPNLVNKEVYFLKLNKKIKERVMKLIQWFKEFNIDKEERDKFFIAIQEKYLSYFSSLSTLGISYQLDLQYNLFKTQQKLEELEKEIKQLKKCK